MNFEHIHTLLYADLILFTEEILNEKLHFLCSVSTCTSDRWKVFCRIATMKHFVVHKKALEMEFYDSKGTGFM